MKQILHKRNVAVVLTALLILCALLWRHSSGDQEKISYLTEPASVGDIEKKVIATGEIAAAQLVTIGAQASGQIDKLHVQLGQKVKKGELIAEIDSTTQINDLDTSKAMLETHKAQLVSREITLKVARQQYKREKELHRREATSRENLENAENAMAKAEADVAETRSLIIQAQISVSTAEANLGYTQIAAPRDGTVVAVPVEEGQTVNANQITPTIVQLADLSRMQIRIQISEGDVTKIAPGMPVSFSILSEPDAVYTANLLSVDPAYTVLTNATEQNAISDPESAVYYYGKLLVDNDDGKLRIGMTTRCSISIAKAQGVLRVPTIAIREKGPEAKYVRVLEHGKPVMRDITTGISDNLYTEVITGLGAGEEIIISEMTAGEISESVARKY